MATLWVICGAGRGVGKTHLARELCNILPDAIYAKLGHGQRKPDKPPNFFHEENELQDFLHQQANCKEHILLESNTHARRGDGDIIIYMDRIPGQTDVRDDADVLKENSDIRLAPDEAGDNWRAVIEEAIDDEMLCEQVCSVLADHAQFLDGSRPSVRSKVWFEVAGRRAFGPGLAHILQGVKDHGSLRAAADAAGMSYRYAWNLIQAAEERLGAQLLLRTPGGAGGGGSELTDAGKNMLRVFSTLNNDVADYADNRFADLYDRYIGGDDDGHDTD